MMKEDNRDSPIIQLISFNKLLKHYDTLAIGEDKALAERAQRILDAQAPYPELREGFSDMTLLEKHKDVINIILQDTFSEVLTNNEIKTASLPYNNVIFNSSNRFKKIIKDAGGQNYIPTMRDFSDHDYYIGYCAVILNFYFGYQIDFRRPFFYDIPDANDVMRHYRILYNADFMEIEPIDNFITLTKEDVEELMDNFDNLALWKEKIPPNSFVSKGFVISNMFDVTAEHSISEIKSSLIGSDKRGKKNFMEGLQDTFRSFFNVPDLRAGFVTYNHRENQFEKVFGKGIESFILMDKDMEVCDEALCQGSYKKLIKQNTYFTISNVDKYYKMSGGTSPYKGLKEQGIKSAIFAPIAENGNLMGVLELVSTKVNALNSINVNKLKDIMPYIVSAVSRSRIEEENLIDAIIQNECTSVHSSVYWKFEEEAKRFIKEDIIGNHPSFKEIVFKNVHPLYGQVDIKNSSKARNEAIQRDLMIQLSEIKTVLGKAFEQNNLPIYEELIYRVGNHIDDIKEVLYTNSEQTIFDFVKNEINPILKHIKKSNTYLGEQVALYEKEIDIETESYYSHRKNYDESVMLINKELATLLDAKQEESQKMFPHYFERYKTDGVEHNMYIGDAIVNGGKFDKIYLKNLRLWQLQVMCEMENAHYNLKPNLPIPLDVTSLVLVHNTSLAIRFRMDEKRFDVDGTYNARYEIIKKRIDKSLIKRTRERLTQTGKMVIVYSQKKDELEYLRYIKFLRSKGYFTKNIEIVELEGLQGVSGLKAIRAEILYKKDNESQKTYTYDDLMEELKA